MRLDYKIKKFKHLNHAKQYNLMYYLQNKIKAILIKRFKYLKNSKANSTEKMIQTEVKN